MRVLLDVNVWVANLMAAAKGRSDTVVQRIVAMLVAGRWGDTGTKAQLVVSFDMLATLENVLLRLGASAGSAEAYAQAVSDIMRHGPEQLDPYLLLGGREQLAMTDAEDAAVLATAIASKTTLLVTDNLKDFRTRDSARIDTRVVTASSGQRQLHALRHQAHNADLIVAHPLDVSVWLERRFDFDPEALWSRISDEARTTK